VPGLRATGSLFSPTHLKKVVEVSPYGSWSRCSTTRCLLPPSKKLSPYEILATVGKGGTGEVIRRTGGSRWKSRIGSRNAP
jgi:hypothetical protein